ncbi:hypothetical protein PN480_07605 [Dolichospermum circinale CS-1225]|uniref:Uncharacterized protein n=1 Tax=Dolichospermum circinale CS-537/01 TaxID=3021739 RepID=A0ABT5AA35_9CYAN|nr:hypothetical protein [Dolichospermum circinale]MDB9457996.1 hypothetical protein [Dolichospermum circinale CS-545/17]MDB9466230.1 hypothetical protein [Dolichospermum circinale CS-539/09]MDB9471462.1 hypothetical protein [Dolichospermum circinale CS-539]MDB9488829.1 hypothetical protein [Dolichospermum circinale CS-537/01]MDB9521812.1 hypothetical protein [Dolichospermum circinale CS-1225]
MQSQSPDPLDELRYLINDLIDRIKAQQQHNLIQDNRLSAHDSRIEEIEESMDLFFRKLGQFDYLIGRNQELEEKNDFYLRD